MSLAVVFGILVTAKVIGSRVLTTLVFPGNGRRGHTKKLVAEIADRVGDVNLLVVVEI